MDAVALFVGIVVAISADGEVSVGNLKSEKPLEECSKLVSEKVEQIAPHFERVSGFCRQLPPKPEAPQKGALTL